MKRTITILLTMLGLASIQAQEDSISNNAYFAIGWGAKYSNSYRWNFHQEVSTFIQLNDRWEVGGCMDIMFYGSGSDEVDGFLFEDFSFHGTRIGIGPAIRYHLSTQRGDQSLGLKAIIATNHLTLYAYDERYEHYDSEGDVSHRFELQSINGESFSRPIVISMVLSYEIRMNNVMALELSLGYDLIPSVSKGILNNPVTLTSTWDEFETYYGNPTLTLASQSEAGRLLNKDSRIWFGIELKFGTYF